MNINEIKEKVIRDIYNVKQALFAGCLSLLVLEAIFFNLFWFLEIRDLLHNSTKGFMWFVVVPLILTGIVSGLMYLWGIIYDKYKDPSVKRGKMYYANMIIGPFLYATFYGVWIYFYRDFTSVRLLYMVIIILAALYQDALYTLIEALWVIAFAVSEFFDMTLMPDAVRLESPPTWINLVMMIFFLILATTLVVVLLNMKLHFEDRAHVEKEIGDAKSTFLANMSHEIRTPINAVLGMNEMILRESKERDIREYAKTIESSGNMLLSIINDILDYSKIESGKLSLVESDYSLSSVINDLMAINRSRAEKKQLELRLECPEDSFEHMHGDEVRIKQVVTNFLTNAIKYTETGSVTLIVNTKKVEDGVAELYIGVKDTGMGIKPEDRENLFESFTRLEKEKNRSVEGTGLGLVIAKSLVGLMDGKLDFESEYGKGSLFYICVRQGLVSEEPVGNLARRYDAYLDNKAEYKESFVAPDASVLAVDDILTNLVVLKHLLKKTEVSITRATSGPDAIELTKKQNFDMIILDHMMPGMDGVETLTEMRKMGVNVPVIALTANALSDSREFYIKAGFDDYLSKPIKGADLEALLQKWLPKEKIK